MKKYINCLNCNKSFYPKDKQSKFCSRDCYNKYNKSGETFICKQCGKSFIVYRHRSEGKYCSKACLYDSLRLTPEQIKERAEIKHNKQEAKRKEKQKEKEQLKAKKKLTKHKILPKTECKVCGKVFVQLRTNMKYCSKKCFNHYDNARRDKRIYKNGKPDLSITLTKLYMRDLGICQLCGMHIDFDCDSNSNHYPSIDHIIPIAKGGKHEWNNVQLACRSCNSKKSDKLI